MRWTLAKKFFTITLLFLLSSFIFLSSVGSSAIRRHLLTNEIRTMTGISNSISTLITSPVQETSRISLSKSILELFATTDEYSIWLIDTNGMIHFSSDNHTNLQIPFDPLLDGLYFRGTYNEYFKQDTISVYSPVIPKNSYQPSGYVLIHSSYARLEPDAHHIISLVYMVWIICVLLWAVCSFILYRLISKPVRRMLQTATSFANDSSEIDFFSNRTDEFGTLSSILTQSFNKLQTVSEDQRQFIANVSHDLRSPLTSIKGYLEAIQDGTIPHELEGKYINIVLNETNRLTDLTRNLLTLTSLDSSNAPLERTYFDINGVIRQVLLTFEQRCQQKGIHFELTFSDHTQIVHADLIKIQQVLYNLIDNAIKFSSDDSVIEIKTTPQYGKLFISIRDYGIGISPENIAKIWNRFYKTDASRGRDKKGTGLGLSIVRDIINLHGESIHVNSNIGSGSEFIFSLPSA